LNVHRFDAITSRDYAPTPGAHAWRPCQGPKVESVDPRCNQEPRALNRRTFVTFRNVAREVRRTARGVAAISGSCALGASRIPHLPRKSPET
jgi:hypothetical protein